MKGFIWTVLTIILLSVAISLGIVLLRANGMAASRPINPATNAPTPPSSDR